MMQKSMKGSTNLEEERKQSDKVNTKMFDSENAQNFVEIDTVPAKNKLSEFINQKKEELGAKMSGYKSKF